MRVPREYEQSYTRRWDPQDDRETVRLNVETEDSDAIWMGHEYVSGVCHGLLTVLFSCFATRVIRNKEVDGFGSGVGMCSDKVRMTHCVCDGLSAGWAG